MALKLSDIQDAYERYKVDISDVTDTQFIEWCEYIYYFVYEKLKAKDPSLFVSSSIYYTVTSPDTFTLPSNLMDIRQTNCGFYKVTQAKLDFDAQTANYVASETLTGATSGATALITAIDDNGVTGTLTIKNITGIFQDNELITSASGSATANGTPRYEISERIGEVQFGDTEEGYYFEGNEVTFTEKEATYLLKYIPEPHQLTAPTEYFTVDGTVSGIELIKDRHEKFLLRAIDVFYEDWDENAGAESIADFKMVRALGEVLDSYSRTPEVSQMVNPANYY